MQRFDNVVRTFKGNVGGTLRQLSENVNAQRCDNVAGSLHSYVMMTSARNVVGT